MDCSNNGATRNHVASMCCPAHNTGQLLLTICPHTLRSLHLAFLDVLQQNCVLKKEQRNRAVTTASFLPSLRGPVILQLLPDSPSSSSCSSRRVRQLSLSALAYSFLPVPPGPEDSSKPGRPTSRRSGFSKRRSPLRRDDHFKVS